MKKNLAIVILDKLRELKCYLFSIINLLIPLFLRSGSWDARPPYVLHKL
jgi:hypothetical protein